MDAVISYAVVTLVALVASIFIVLLNLKHARGHVRNLDFRVIAIELITLTIWVFLLTKVLRATSAASILQASVVFVLSIGFGVVLIRSTLRELRTERATKTLITALHDTNERLRQLDAQKTEFVSIASHQLRGPLSAITGHIDMLLKHEYGALPKRAQEPLERVQSAAHTLNEKINALLDISDLEKGTLTCAITPFDVVAAVEAAVSDLEPVCAQAELTCTRTYNPHDPIQVLGDPAKARQVFMAILDNAIRYTSVGTITISIAVKHRDAIISIQDTGVGIEPTEIRSLFKKFTRGSNAASVQTPGSGIGLYAAKEFLERQGGHIWISSAGKNKGTTCFVSLPLHHAY